MVELNPLSRIRINNNIRVYSAKKITFLHLCEEIISSHSVSARSISWSHKTGSSLNKSTIDSSGSRGQTIVINVPQMTWVEKNVLSLILKLFIGDDFQPFFTCLTDVIDPGVQ